jgi:hypothetical protein
MPLAASQAKNSEAAPIAAIDQQLFLLETLKSSLDGAIRALSSADPSPLLETSRQISSTCQDLLALSLQLSRLPGLPDAQQRRHKLLAELGQQRAVCRAMLRRWRRSISLRRQLLSLRSEPEPYADSVHGWS